MNICVCCHNKLLRHLKHNQLYWFCPNCHQEMPNIDLIYLKSSINPRKNNYRKYSLINKNK